MFRAPRIPGLMALGLVAVLTAGCAGGPVDEGAINDPFEATNRQIHAFNKSVDSAILRPVARTYGAVVPAPLREMIENGASNLSEPRYFVNHVLQGDPDAAAATLGRFLLNSTLGILGLGDPATNIGLFQRPTDFGETLGAWGAPEGAYVELPLLGPSTVRDTIGMVVDLAIDPVTHIVTEEQAYYLFALRSLNLVNSRHAYADLIDLLLYESADSYTAQRLTYLQNKRRALAGEIVVEDLDDPFAFN